MPLVSLFARFFVSAALLWIAAPTLSWADFTPLFTTLPTSSPVPGGIALVPLGMAEEAPQAWFLEHRVAVLPDNREGNAKTNSWVAVVGLPLTVATGSQTLRVTKSNTETLEHFSVQPKTYSQQRFTVADKRKVAPLPEDDVRIAREQKRIDEIKAQWRAEPQLDLSFQLPAVGRSSGTFGLRRIINGLERAPHAGIDVVVPTGTEVYASGAGIVLEVGDYFFNGNSIYIDHGQGVVTLYCHLSRIDVRAGDHLAKGQLIGLSGMTGRATGPHLHWTVLMNGVAVDPQLFIAPQ